jgi:glycolate oxidase iron-sulfur subunit
MHYHAGSRSDARQMADANAAAFDMKGSDAIVVNHGGCGAMLGEDGPHWHGGEQTRRQVFAEMIQDAHEFIDGLGPVAPDSRIDAVATYHHSYHPAHSQKVVQPPRRPLGMIPGLQLRDQPETDICCGSAGTYNLNYPAMADRVLDRKIDNILRTGAQIVLATNAGCLLQIDIALRHRRQNRVLASRHGAVAIHGVRFLCSVNAACRDANSIDHVLSRWLTSHTSLAPRRESASLG